MGKDKLIYARVNSELYAKLKTKGVTSQKIVDAFVEEHGESGKKIKIAKKEITGKMKKDKMVSARINGLFYLFLKELGITGQKIIDDYIDKHFKVDVKITIEEV